MTSFALVSVIIYSLFILVLLFCIDLKTRLLPNRYVLQFFFAGLAFHIISGFSEAHPLDLFIATVLSSSLLLVIRSFGNKFYGIDTLGIGDVKLIGAAGIWLGSEYIFLAMALGALAGVFHGLGIIFYSRFVMKKKVPFNTLSIPAGPGFIVGIIVCAALKYHTFIQGLF